MPEYLHPGVYIEETSFRGKPIQGVGTSTAGFVGAATSPAGRGTGKRTRTVLAYRVDGRHLCFSQYTPGDYMCESCPETTKLNCIQNTPGAKAEEQMDYRLVQLHSALSGS